MSHIIRETVQSAVPAVISQSASALQPREDNPPPPPDPVIDLPQAIAKAEQSVARIYSGSPKNQIFVGLGVVLDAGGTIIIDADALGKLSGVNAVVGGASSTPMKVLSQDSASGFVYLSPVATSSSRHFVPAALSGGSSIVGQSVVAFAGKSELRIASGLVVAVGSALLKTVILTDIGVDSIMKGTPIIDEKGQFLGLSTAVSRASEGGAFMPIQPPSSHTGSTAGSP